MLTISDTELAFDHLGVGQGVPNVTVRATPLLQPLWRVDGDTPIEDLSGGVEATTGQDGSWTLALPWPSESSPDTVTWLLTRADGTQFTGTVPEGVTDDMTVAGLVFGHGWALVGGTHPLLAIQGPPGQAGPDATTSSVGSVLVDQAPSMGHPVALTAPRRGAANGVAELDGNGLIPVGELPTDVVRKSQANTFAGAFNLFNSATTSNNADQTLFKVVGTYTLSGTASYTTLQVKAVEVSLGSGATLLADFRCGSTAFNTTSKATIDHSGNVVAQGGLTATTLSLSDAVTTTAAPATGGAAALPNPPAGYLKVKVNGQDILIPYWLPA